MKALCYYSDQMKVSELEDGDKIVTKDYLEIVIGRLENKLIERFNDIDAKFNRIDGRFNNQRNLIIIAIITVLAQIVNAWILRK